MQDRKTDRAADYPTTVGSAAEYLAENGEAAVVFEPDGDDPDAAGAAADPGEPLYEVTLPDGDRHLLPITELVEGYLRAQDYMAQTAELTEHRRQLGQMRQRLRDLIEHAEALRPEHVAQVLPPLPLPDPMLAQTDPVGYGRQRAAVDMELARRQQLMQVIEQESARRQAQIQARHQAYEAEQQQRLLQAWPELGGADAADLLLKLRDGMSRDYGFSPDELDLMTDHRLRLVARDALRWRQAEADMRSAEAARRPPPRTAAPAGTEARNGAALLLDRIGRSGSRERDMRLAAQYLIS